MQRELPKMPELPVNFDELIDDITEICFLPLGAEPVDIVLVHGNWNQMKHIPQALEKFYHANLSKHFILTSGPPTADYSHVEQIAVADCIYSMLSEDFLKNCHVDMQNKSMNSVEEVTMSMEFLEPFATSRIGCVSCNWAIGRQINYLRKYMPKAEIVPMPYETIYDGEILTIDNWHQNTDWRKRVWSEIIRIKLYGERGDMAYPNDLRQKIDSLFSKIKP